MSFALVSYYLLATGHSAKKKKGKNSSLCMENCLLWCGRLGQKETNVESSQAEVLGGKNEISWVPSAPWDTQNWMVKVTCRISYCCCDLHAEYWGLAFG